ncbi:A-kinase anchor protein 10, mitochondrial-like [Mercenaria mercenaria]|uniref:A-kinase anchor protein 10, mitochondrial-like n=1 Tax=Mercenaria mercenaria TaxID=6596 RepID=UPI00234EAA3F|nr:A-kinase anchor protein 10, mitochondrial-like [Mercenaria mercenaria]
MSFFRRHSEKKKKERTASFKKNSVPQIPANLGLAESEARNGKPAFNMARQTQTGGLLLEQDDFYPGDLGMSHQPQDEYVKKSRLSKSLTEVLKDHEAVAYLIQYMDSCKASALIRFWLDAGSFQASTWTRIRTHSLQSVSKSSLIKTTSDLSTDSLTQSINKDITSPVSGASLDLVDQGLQSGSVEAHSSAFNSNLDQNKPCDQTEQADAKEDKTKQYKIQLDDLTEENIPSDVSDNSEGNVKDCDSRVREKCKTGEEKINMSLPIEPCDSSAVDNKLSESAISYRDIASPSPTDQEANDSQSSAKSNSYSSSNLAEKLKKSVEQDAVRIFTKYLAQEATHPIGITDDLRNDTIRKICREDGQVDPECFVDCQNFAVNQIEQRYFEGFAASVYHCKYQVEVLTGGKLHLTDILYNDTALFYFMEYMEQEGLSHMLQFVIAADNFEHLLISQGNYDGLQAQEDAMVLYDKYFSLQAVSPLGFPQSIRFEIEGNICREGGPLPDCFSKPRKIVLHTIQRRHLQHYLTSDVYYKYLSELVSAVQTAQDFPIGQRKRRGSETSSEHSVGAHSVGAHSVGSESVSSRNTLLAAGTSRRVQLHKLDENMKNMTLDPGLLNPDKLWERPEAGRMSLGQIDGLGQFVSRFDPDPEVMTSSRKKSTTGSKFFKSKKEKEKEQEEMARKVAEMILKDVTSVTQAISAIKNGGDDT